MPESGKVTLKAQLASEVAHIRQLRPDVRIVAIADAAADNWTFLETLSPETEVIDFWHACEHLRTASDHAVASDCSRGTARFCVTTPVASTRRSGRCATFVIAQSRIGPRSNGNSPSSASTASACATTP